MIWRTTSWCQIISKRSKSVWDTSQMFQTFLKMLKWFQSRSKQTVIKSAKSLKLFFSSGLADVAQGSVLTEREASRNLNKKVYHAVVIYTGSIYVKKRHNHRRPANPPARFAFSHQKANQQKQTHSNKKGARPNKNTHKINRCCLHSGKKPTVKIKITLRVTKRIIVASTGGHVKMKSIAEPRCRNSVQPANPYQWK